MGSPAGRRLTHRPRARDPGPPRCWRPGGSRSSRSARSCSKSSARAGGGAIRPIRRPSSATSARVLERLGMRREAHFVRNEFIKGEWTDEVVYAMLEDEWQSQQA